MDDRVVIALFRHGMTVENQRKAYLGWNDSPLCQEAARLACSKEYEGYFSSDLQRCVLTAKRLFSPSHFQLLKEFREMDFGEWEGKTYEQLKSIEHYQRWLSDPFHICPPKGESFEQFSSRVQSGWKKLTAELISKKLQSCAVITHGGVIKYLLSVYAPREQDFWSWHTPYYQGFELCFTLDSLRRGERCTLLQEVPLMVNGHG
ncbi:histidine phosphatase family protein [Neobacillus muris]|uniref:histidine phosphatase family protein n=1 Tax=Neobacillus muris TaxID=2941334 RepID=UPI00204210DB|nr:histidine phosphatase family protein [Neobacillus muris]